MLRKWKRNWERKARAGWKASLLTGAVWMASCGAGYAAPTGGEVVAGSAEIAADGNTTTIVQATDKAVLNWQGFDIGRDEIVNFRQPDAASIALNRVLGNEASRIFGRLEANGQVFLVNPNGVFFAQGASVDVGGLVASTRNIRTEDFLQGKYSFEGSGQGAYRPTARYAQNMPHCSAAK